MLARKHAQQHQEYGEECLNGMWMKHNKIKFSSWQVSIEMRGEKRMNFSFETLRNYFIKIYIWIYNVFIDSVFISIVPFVIFWALRKFAIWFRDCETFLSANPNGTKFFMYFKFFNELDKFFFLHFSAWFKKNINPQ